MDDEMRCLIEQIEKRFDSLREADREAVRLAHADLSQRLEGFPQQFATKDEMEAASLALQRLEKDAVTREIYETQSRQLSEMVQKLDKEKLPETVYQTFVANYRDEQERAATERRAVASALAAGVERQAGAREQQGEVRATRGQVLAIAGGATGILGFIIVAANYLAQ